jgi:hypothetical protein
VEAEFLTSTQLQSPLGKAYAVTYHPPIPAVFSTAVSNIQTAYTDAAGHLNPNNKRINPGGGVLRGVFGSSETEGNGEAHPSRTGVYTFGSSVSIEQDITFEGINRRLHHSDIR